MIFNPLSRKRPGDDGVLHVLVDLSALWPGGSNGGMKGFHMGMLGWLGAQARVPLRFTFLVNAAFHPEAKALQRPADQIIRVGPRFPGDPGLPGGWRTGDHEWPFPPPDLARQVGADVVYAAMSSARFLCPGIPTVSFIADVLHRDFPQSLPAAEVERRESQYKALLGLSNRVQCASHFTAGQLGRHYGARPGQLLVTYASVVPWEAPGDAGPEPAQGPFFLYPANGWIHKNHEGLLAGYRSYLDGKPADPWPLVLTGHQDERIESVMRTAEALGVASRVRHLGYLSGAQLRKLWRRAGALVFASRYEGFGIPLIEAMHHGVPVACSRAGSLPEVASDSALYFDAGDPAGIASALLRLSTDGALRKSLVAAGRLRLASFGLESGGGRLLDALVSASREPAAPFCSGADPSGRIARRLVAGLPARTGTLIAEIEVIPPSSNARVAVYQDQLPLGGFRAPPGARTVIRVPLSPSARSLTIEVPNVPECSESGDAGGEPWVRRITLISEGLEGGRTPVFAAPC
jgi:glycosyltransferase involved in cell wall biosynthesis